MNIFRWHLFDSGAIYMCHDLFTYFAHIIATEWHWIWTI